MKPYKLHSISAEEAERQHGSKPVNEMVERVALALEPKLRGFGPGDTPMQIARELARAAIAAMRDPTHDMINAGDIYAVSHYGINNIWQSMIDAALADGK